MSYAEELFAKTLDRMIEAREYKLQKEVSSDVKVYTTFDGRSVVVYFSVYSSLNKKSLEEIATSMTQLGCKNAIIACKTKTSSSNNEAFKRIEILDFNTSLHDPTKIGGGAVTVRKLKQHEGRPPVHCIPTMLTSDKVARFLECKHGDVVVISRSFPEISSVPFLEYRAVQTTSEKSNDEIFDEEGDEEGDAEGDESEEAVQDDFGEDEAYEEYESEREDDDE